jgi:hypothetical protein
MLVSRRFFARAPVERAQAQMAAGGGRTHAEGGAGIERLVGQPRRLAGTFTDASDVREDGARLRLVALFSQAHRHLDGPVREATRVGDLSGEEKAFRPAPVERRAMALDAELLVEPHSALELGEGLAGTSQPGEDQSAQGEGLGEPHRNIPGAAQLHRPLAQDEGLRELSLDHVLAGKEARKHRFGDRIQIGPFRVGSP